MSAKDDTNTPDKIIATKENIINNINEKFALLIKSNNIATITSPILLYLNKATNTDAKKTINNNSPILFKLLVNIFIMSLSF